MWREVSNFGLKFHLQGLTAPRRVIGFDFGSQFTGVSITDASLTNVTKKPVGVVIGIPSAVKAVTEGNDIYQRIRNVAQQMGGGTVPFTFVDYNWSTKQAHEQLKYIQDFYRIQGHLNHDKDLVDGMAAIIILRRFLEYFQK